ncbi:MAG: DEDD exonuclease domain-containing protein [Acidimicrobiales bacterium]
MASGGSQSRGREGGQLAFDDLSLPLHLVTFVVFDLETTGGSPGGDAITEVGAVKVRGGQILGTFATLVNPGTAIPPLITSLTGITETMVRPAPRAEAVLPAFLEWVGADAVLVGHNVRFDVSFVRAACDALGYDRPANQVVDTCSLARRLLRDEVPNCKLATLADRLRLPHRPTHRALDDAWATVDLLHLLLERVGCLGATHLDDLLELPKAAGHPQGQKLRWVASLPRAPGVYIFRDVGGRALYVGKAVDLRRRVRQYFGQDDRRKIPQLLREAASLDHLVCAHELEAAVLEMRMIHQLEPRFNRQGTRWRRYRWLRLTDEAWPRLSVVRTARPGDLGPLASDGAARLVVEAVQDALPLRRCTTRLRAGAAGRDGPCTAAQLGVALCPCAGQVAPEAYAEVVASVRAGLSSRPAVLLDPLAARMRALARDRRFEEAAAMRDRAGALARAVHRQRRLEALRAAGRLVVEVDGEGGAVLDGGRLTLAWPAGPRPLAALAPPAPDEAPSGPPAASEVDEMLAVAAWLDARTPRLHLLAGNDGLSWPVAPVPAFEARRARRAHTG